MGRRRRTSPSGWPAGFIPLGCTPAPRSVRRCAGWRREQVSSRAATDRSGAELDGSAESGSDPRPGTRVEAVAARTVAALVPGPSDDISVLVHEEDIALQPVRVDRSLPAVQDVVLIHPDA